MRFQIDNVGTLVKIISENNSMMVPYGWFCNAVNVAHCRGKAPDTNTKNGIGTSAPQKNPKNRPQAKTIHTLLIIFYSVK